MKVIRKYISDDDFREALDKAPPGIIDPRSSAPGLRLRKMKNEKWPMTNDKLL
jgi:hypothetical protein